jgi:hypothetical protein
MGPLELWTDRVVGSILVLWSVRNLLIGVRLGRTSEIKWRIAYVLAFGLATGTFFLSPLPKPGHWNPRIFADFPGVLVWPAMAAALYAALGERRYRKARDKAA